MKLLAVDTATNSCGVAVVNGTATAVHAVRVSQETHSRHLLPMIDQALQTAGLTAGDMDGFVVTRGPGSFTGLRIGLSTIKGLIAAANKPVAAVSSLDALAGQFLGTPRPLIICALLDARKGEVYTCRYRLVDSVMEKLSDERALSPREAVADFNEPFVPVGPGAIAYRAIIKEVAGPNAVFVPAFQNNIRPEVVADLGQRRLEKGDSDDPDALTPAYIRQPDAVINQQ